MASVPAPADLVCFGEFHANLRTRELYRQGKRIRIPDQSFRVLMMLVARPGQLITRDEIRQSLWGDAVFVDFEHGLNNAINRLRESLRDSAESPKYIETLPRRGYRLIATVSYGTSAPEGDKNNIPVPAEVRGQSDAEHTNTLKLQTQHSSGRNRSWILVSSVGTLLIALVVLGLWQIRPKPSDRIRSLAVLPLENLSTEAAQEYFADGLTDALITDLAAINSLRVISRTSVMHYKGTRSTLPQIARELNVDAVIEGTITVDKQTVRTNVQLVDARNDRHLWAMKFERDRNDILTLEAEIANAIRSQLSAGSDVKTTQLTIANRKVSPEAHENYLRGRYAALHGAFTPEGWKEAREYFNRAIQLEPTYPDAILGLAETYILDDPATARLLALKALEQNGNSAEAHVIVGVVSYRRDWQFDVAQKEFRTALQLDPNSFQAHDSYGVFLAQTGHFQEALVQLEEAEQLDPLSPEPYCDIGLALYLSHRYEESIAQLKKALAIDPKVQMANRHLLRIYEVRGQITEYINTFPKAPSWYNLNESQAKELAQRWRRAYGTGGARAFWQERLKFELQRRVLAHPFGLARIYAQLGDRDKAIAQLRQAYDHRDSLLVSWLKADPQFDGLRSDLRFQRLLEEIGYPE